MTDVPSGDRSILPRLGVALRRDPGGAAAAPDGCRLVVGVEPGPATTSAGILRASVLALAADVGAGLIIDRDPGSWWFTSDLALRMRPRPTRGRVDARTSVLRRGGRSVTCEVHVTDAQESPLAYSALTFSRVDRRPTDPPKPPIDLERFEATWGREPAIVEPLRSVAGIEVIDGSRGIVEVEVTPELCNPAGALQGAIVALVAEAAAEELVGHRLGGPALVTELDVRYLAQARTGPVRTSAQILADTPDGPVLVRLVDVATGRLVTHVMARAVPHPGTPATTR